MREIKFRGKNKDTNKWVYGWYTKLTEGIRRFDAIISDLNEELTRFYIHNPETIGQYTGFKTQNQSLIYDNSKELFEGDIFRLKNSDTVYLLIFENGRWIGKSTKGDDWGKFTCEIYNVWKEIILIGNIHDNPNFIEA